MSKVRSDNISNRANDGAPKLTFGAEVPVGYGITGAGGINITGVATAASFSGNISGTTGTFTGNVSVGGTLTYEDVTNVDSVGIVTARTGVRVTAGGLVVTAGVSTFAADASIADKIVHTGDTDTAIRFPAADTFTVETAGNERLRISPTAGLLLNNGELVERVNIVAGKLSDNSNINLDNGMVHYFTTTETTASTPNIISSVGIDTTMSTGDTMAVTIITTAAAAGYSARVSIDGLLTGITTSWVGGSEPSEGGSSGVDIYNYTIIKTGSAAYQVIGNYTATS